jgi:hypothetical protein
VTDPSSKKPRAELDKDLWYSVDHPRGDVLCRLIDAGKVHARAYAGRTKRGAGDDDISDGCAALVKRFRRGDVFNLVSKHGVRSVLEIQALAAEQAKAGDARLAEFCTSSGDEQLELLVRSAVGVMEAPKAIALQASSRMDLLRRAAAELPCECGGCWMEAARRLLDWHKEDVSKFCRDVCAALELGALRGVNMAIVGEPGCGKSMIYEPFDKIFKVMGKPEAKSTFPMANVVDAHVLLWQEYKHRDRIVLFEDLLALAVGERMELRIPHQKNKSHRNTAPLFFTSNSMLAVIREDPNEMQRLNTAMVERFNIRFWLRPIPMGSRVVDLAKCGRCCANFLLLHR